MKRRDFVKMLPAFALGTSMLHVAKPTHLIALGSAASRLIEKYASELKFDTLTFVNDRLPQNLSLPYKFISYHPPESEYTFFGKHKILKDQPIPEIVLSESIKQQVDSLEGKLIVFAALGNFTGTAHYQALAKYLSSKQIKAQFICILPFRFEGSKRLRNAYISSEAVENLGLQDVFPRIHSGLTRKFKYPIMALIRRING